jgi:hypothetical protein
MYKPLFYLSPRGAEALDMKNAPNDGLGLCVLVIEADEKHTKSSFLLWTYSASAMKETSSNIERCWKTFVLIAVLLSSNKALDIFLSPQVNHLTR